MSSNAKTNDSCYQCQERKLCCHSTCEAHRQRKEKHDAKREEIRANKRREQEAISVLVTASLKAIKRRGR